VNPICYGNRRLSCRCIVLMRSASPGDPELYIHDRVFFQSADIEDEIDSSNDAAGLNDQKPQKEKTKMTPFPIGYKIIQELENQYKDYGFDWKGAILPKLHHMIRELFEGMTIAYPNMSKSDQSRAIYGVDVMFNVQNMDDTHESKFIEPKLTEVTFCPENPAVREFCENDEGIRQIYNNEIFCCLFLGETDGRNITRIN